MSDPIRARLDEILQEHDADLQMRATLLAVLDELDAADWVSVRMPSLHDARVISGRSEAIRRTIADALGVGATA